MSRLQNLLAALAATALLGACATQVEPPRRADTVLPLPLPVAASLPHVSFQNPALEPANGGRFVPASELMPGDILLTAANGITSIGIRLATLAPVSHAALYAGDGDVVEAVGEGVRRRSLDEVLAEESVVVAFRHPALDVQAAARVRSFALDKVGTRYSHVGVMLHAPFALQRRLCELPLVPSGVRDFCVRGVASIQLGASSNERFFLLAAGDGGLPPGRRAHHHGRPALGQPGRHPAHARGRRAVDLGGAAADLPGALEVRRPCSTSDGGRPPG
ncbi:MAG: hypothetical protein QM765_11800 [Myxococcales bacterium]